ncbi:hypothetical protein [Novosphingobium sp. PC22D]|uniref:hypothetical protein n=1 Tax=Novosphingobium sp. PC22D TaxID=1962403 RepID=UPI001F0AA3D5|nr:hypothetical protein [Novosphingobium sp. PC22D]
MANEIVGLKGLVTALAVCETLRPAIEQIAGTAADHRQRKSGQRCELFDQTGCALPFGPAEIGVDDGAPLARVTELVEHDVDGEHRGGGILAARHVENDPCSASDRREDFRWKREGRQACRQGAGRLQDGRAHRSALLG